MHNIIAIGIFQALIAAVLLWKNKLRSTPDGLLILFIMCIACHLTIKFVIYNFINDAQVRQQMNTFIGFCYGPLLYLYSLKVSDDRFIPASKWYVFIPFILAAIAYFTVASVLYFSNTSGYVLLNWYNQATGLSILASDMFYVFLALRNRKKYLGIDKKKEKQMVGVICNYFLLIVFSSIPFYIAMYVFGFQDMILFRSTAYAILTCLCVTIVYYKYVVFAGQNEIDYFTGKNVAWNEFMAVSKETISNPLPDHKTPEMPAKKFVLPEDKQREIWDKLENHMAQARLFTDSDLNLDKLAQLTGINKYHISETLNNYAQKPFYQYINEYRIRYTIEQIQNLQRKQLPINLLTLSYDAGFKAKSSFNRYFKEITGITPTEHIKSFRIMEKIA